MIRAMFTIGAVVSWYNFSHHLSLHLVLVDATSLEHGDPTENQDDDDDDDVRVGVWELAPSGPEIMNESPMDEPNPQTQL